MKMKKLKLALASIGVIALLAGCGNSKEDANGEKELVIGVDDKFAPMGFRDEANELTGFDIDYAKAAAKHMGMKAKFQPIDWKAKETELASGRIDLIWNGYTITDDRKKKVLFTKPYLSNAQVVAVLKDSNIKDLADLEGKTVGLQALSSAADALEANPIADKVKNKTEFADNVLALSDLKSKRVEAVIIDEVVMDYYMSKEDGTFKVLDETLAPEEYGVGVKKGNDDLLKKLQDALDTMNEDGTAAQISETWFGENKVLK